MIINFKYTTMWFNKSSDEQKNAATQQQQFATTLQSNYNDQLGQANSSNQFLTQRLQSIFNQAQAGYGFTPAQESALKTQNIEGQAQATQQANLATNRRIQQMGNGGGTTSGAAAQIAAQTARSSANAGAANNLNINIANAQQAQSNLANTGSLLSGLSAQQSSLAANTGSTAVGQSGQAFNAINSAYQPSNFWGNLGQGLLSGGLGALGTIATGGIPTGGSGGGIAGSLGGLFGGNPMSGTQAFQNQYGQMLSGG